jgi:hypothetical protein
MKNFIELDQIICSSILSFQDKQILLSFFKNVDDQELLFVIDLLKKHPQWMDRLAQNIKKKTGLGNSDDQDWNKILEQEKLELEKMLSS